MNTVNNFLETRSVDVGLFPISARIKKGSKIQCPKVDQTRQTVRHTSGESRVKTREIENMKAISTLAGGIAHQFNNSLFVITANLIRHDGWIGVESKPGQGTIVTIHLPAIQAADQRGGCRGRRRQ